MPRRRGATLIELMFAMTLLGIAVTGFTAAMLGLTARTARSSWQVARDAVLSQEVSRVLAAPFATLVQTQGCVTVAATAGRPIAYERCVQVTTVSTTEREARIVVQPAAAGMRPDTLRVRRSAVTNTGPF